MLNLYDAAVLGDSAPVGLSGEAAPLYGLVAMWALTVMVVTSIGIVRNKLYELFLIVHFLWVLAVLMVILHVPWTIWGFVPGVLVQLAGMVPTVLAAAGTPADSKVACHVLADGRTLITLDVPVPSRTEPLKVKRYSPSYPSMHNMHVYA
jgi:hypothetical protein